MTQEIQGFERNNELRLVNNPDQNNFFKFVGKKLKSKTAIPALKGPNGEVHTDSISKSNCFLVMFSSVFVADNGLLPTFSRRVPAGVNIPELIISQRLVHKALSNFKSKFSRTPDGFPSAFIHQIVDFVVEPVSRIYEVSYQTGSLPLDWRTGLIAPVFKKGAPSEPLNYRPVSLTSYFCKGMEKLICSHILKFLYDHGLLTPHQHGFLSGKSCDTALLESVLDWTLAIRHKNSVDVIFLDFKKAFDSVGHAKLLFKMERYGLGGKLLEWVRAFLTERRHMVSLEGVVSNEARVGSGVPQGSVLGPILFVLFVNDIPDVVENTNVKLKLYADDVKLYAEIENSDGHIEIQEALRRISEWAAEWQLSLAIPKCKALTISHNRFPPIYPYSLFESELDRVEQFRDLGVIVNSRLNFSQHCLEISRKAFIRVNLLFRIIKHLDFHYYITAYKTYVRPIVETCSVVWAPWTERDVSVLEAVQRSFSFRLFRKFNCPYSGYLYRCRICGLESLKTRRLKLDLLFLFKLLHGYVRSGVTQFLRFDRSGLGLVPYYGTDRTAHVFPDRIVKCYNAIPEHIRQSTLVVFSEYLDKNIYVIIERY